MDCCGNASVQLHDGIVIAEGTHKYKYRFDYLWIAADNDADIMY